MSQIPLRPKLPAQHEPRAWIDSFVSTFSNLWTQAISHLNALSTNNTLAMRPTVNLHEGSFFVADDTKQLFSVVNMVYENVGPRRGSVAIANPATTAAVTLTPNEPDANYRLTLSTDYDANFLWWTAKATTGFTVNVAVSPGTSATVDWLLTRD